VREVLCGKVRTALDDASYLIYFRSLLIGYFEGIGAERRIAWRFGDSLALRRFVGIALDEYTADHSTISRTRRLIDWDTHREWRHTLEWLISRSVWPTSIWKTVNPPNTQGDRAWIAGYPEIVLCQEVLSPRFQDGMIYEIGASLMSHK
jgi:hypothetical protein